ncbi:hypothetical protein C0585_00670 [Candidatus Woesearchaeota archaeon]|nr:MAG: hypothetical protein C0585_00670 [Candidatus Woesearchaeota archaeon]
MLNLNKLFVYSFALLMLLLINVPTVHKEFKILILFVLIIIVIYKFITNRLFIDKNIFTLAFISLVFSSFFILNGILMSNPGAVPSMSVIIVWPILYILLIATNGYNNIFITLEKVFLISAYFIPLYGLYFLLGKANLIPSLLFINIFPEDVMGGVGLYEGSIEVSILNLASVLFIAPYMFANFLLKNNIKDKIVYGIALFLLLGIVFLSGRRALLLVVLFSLPLILFLATFINNKNTKKIIFLRISMLVPYVILLLFILLTIVLSYYDIDLNKMYDGVLDGLNFSSSVDPSTIARTEQFFALMEGFSNSPILGNGFGAVASVIRNGDMPWAYELSYIALLFHTGLIGLTLYLLLIGWIIIEGLKISKDTNAVRYIFPYIVGLISFLIGNMSNPYLMKFDYLLVIFIPVMYINYYKLRKKKGFEI